MAGEERVTIDLDLALKIFTIAVSLGTAIYAYFVNRRKDVDKRFDAGSKRMTQIEARTAKLEHQVNDLPGKDDFHTLQLEMVRQTGALENIKTTMDGNAKLMGRLEAVVSRHEDHLIDGAKS